MILAESTLDIPTQDFTAFIACNAKGGSGFYKLKDKILHVFGKENDYDLQHITKKCHTCNGSGWYYKDTRCNRCSNGVYEAYDVVLQRFLLNNSCFHIPVGRLEGNRLKIWDGYYPSDDEWEQYPCSKWRYEPFTGIIKNAIQGLIKHTVPNSLNTNWAYWYLLYKYDHAEWLSQTGNFLNVRYNKKEFQKRNYLWLTSNHGLTALAKYYECEEDAKKFNY